ncbi:MAG: pitrilysin family protein [Bacteroidota bacterium]|nr:pitrilysin family protein [Bacteroidota bacterium]
MIKFERFTLDNGLKVIVHQDKSTEIVAINILYNVGSRDEDPEKTGFAHLFEHLMFGGSVNIAKYDEPLEKVGGENNAFTNEDITNYYLTLPKTNLETGFWLESDRMLSLAFSEKSLEVQRNVVCEEFKQSYLNQPYGDVWLLLKPLAYKVHPYQWTTIGKEISHIENAKMEDVKSFFKKYYCPNNAIMVVAGNVETDQVKKLTEKWFGPIPRCEDNNRALPVEPEQKEARTLTVKRDIPYDAFIRAYHCCSRLDKDYYGTDFISDILSSGKSARLYKKLIKEKKMFSELHAYITGDIDAGLFVFYGKLIKGVKIEDAEKAIEEEIERIKNELVDDDELEKVKNRAESSLEFSEMGVLNKAMNLAYYELLGDAELVNNQINLFRSVTKEDIKNIACKIFRTENSSTLYYLSKNL